jgi:hypothetical protein
VLVPISVSVLTQIKIWSTLMLILLAAHRGGLYTLFFAGIIAVGFGSSYYHLNPKNVNLCWDTLLVSLS